VRARIVDADALKAVSPQALRAYATAEGWEPTEPFGDHSHVYVHSGGKSEAIIPATARLGDYAAIVGDLVTLFAEVEGRGDLQVYRDLTTADRDVVRLRTRQADDDGAVQVSAGVELVVHARDLLLSAACSAWSPRPSYRAGKVRVADDYMSRVRLGQTEQGSFVVTLLGPVPPAIVTQGDIWPDIAAEPYERLVTRRLANGLDAAANAIERLNLGAGPSVFETAVHQGLSANLCEAAASLSEGSDGIEVSITWARTRPTPQRRWMRVITRSDGETLREVARHFHERQSRPDELIEGVIVKLARKEAEFDGRVTLKAAIDGKLVSVAAQLKPADYNIAVGAHQTRAPISLMGTLERVGRRWKLNDPYDVRLASDELDDEE
jgi:hypothetical protein